MVQDTHVILMHFRKLSFAFPCEAVDIYYGLGNHATCVFLYHIDLVNKCCQYLDSRYKINNYTLIPHNVYLNQYVAEVSNSDMNMYIDYTTIHIYIFQDIYFALSM